MQAFLFAAGAALTGAGAALHLKYPRSSEALVGLGLLALAVASEPIVSNSTSGLLGTATGVVVFSALVLAGSILITRSLYGLIEEQRARRLRRYLARRQATTPVELMESIALAGRLMVRAAVAVDRGLRRGNGYLRYLLRIEQWPIRVHWRLKAMFYRRLAKGVDALASNLEREVAVFEVQAHFVTGLIHTMLSGDLLERTVERGSWRELTELFEIKESRRAGLRAVGHSFEHLFEGRVHELTTAGKRLGLAVAKYAEIREKMGEVCATASARATQLEAQKLATC